MLHRTSTSIAVIALLACAGQPRNVNRYDLDCTDPANATHPLVRVDPYYPPRAFHKRIPGWVEVHLEIGSEGEVADATVLRSDPPGIFDEEVLETVRQWRYCPPNDVISYPDGIKTRLRFERR